jgi:hypothetical protein
MLDAEQTRKQKLLADKQNFDGGLGLKGAS